MAQIGLFYGSTNGHTATIAQQIKQKLDDRYAAPGDEVDRAFDLAACYLADGDQSLTA